MLIMLGMVWRHLLRRGETGGSLQQQQQRKLDGLDMLYDF